MASKHRPVLQSLTLLLGFKTENSRQGKEERGRDVECWHVWVDERGVERTAHSFCAEGLPAPGLVAIIADLGQPSGWV